MKLMTRSLAALAITLAAGCAVSNASHRYEYKIEYDQQSEKLENRVNQLANDGWCVEEFTVSSNGSKYVVLKRKRVD
jgi:negative regulator of sigma E activity